MVNIYNAWALLLLTFAAASPAQFVSKLANPPEPIKEDAALSTIGLIKKYGYPAEVHSVVTEDGYILEMHRIPYSPVSPAAPNKPAVLVMHGLFCASSVWVLMGPNMGLAYLLADRGYDVWMGNSRGNIYSRKHTKLDPDASDGRFWQFSWHEMGVYDITAKIDYILAKVGQQKLFYIGHSQGTTQFYVMASVRPEYNAKIRAMFSLAPVAFMNNLSNFLMQMLSKLEKVIVFSLEVLGVHEFLPSVELMHALGHTICNDEAITQIVCTNVLFLIGGFDSKQINTTMIPVILGHTPAGASTRQVIHYSQLVVSGHFRRFDHDVVGNMKLYGQKSPPDYDLKKITCPVALHYSSNDALAAIVDVDRLYEQLSNPIGKFLVPFKDFNHFDFLWAIDSKTLLYNKVFSLMRGF